MAEVSIKNFADQIGITPDKLLAQLVDAGIDGKATEDFLSDEEKMALLGHLRGAHDKSKTSDRNKITLKHKTSNKIKQTTRTGGSRTIHVEVKKRRTFVKRSDLEEQAVQEAEAAAAAEAQRVAEEEAKVKAEKEKEEEAARIEAEKVKEAADAAKTEPVVEPVEAPAEEAAPVEAEAEPAPEEVAAEQIVEEPVVAAPEPVAAPEEKPEPAAPPPTPKEADKPSGKRAKDRRKRDELHVAAEKKGRPQKANATQTA